MIKFLIEFINWVKNREYRDEIAQTPYFWGEPKSREGYMRYKAFLRATGLEEMSAQEKVAIIVDH